jgi:tRNA threonylcarbamoyladenosine biosynthesis protein TsaE
MQSSNAIRTIQLADAAATQALGAGLATDLGAGAVLLLSGGLGAGKTCLVQGLARGLGIEEPVTSPTFALAQHYRAADGRALVHLDLYRLESPASADELFDQELEEADVLGALMAVEWPERLSRPPAGAWRLALELAGEGRLAVLQPPPSAL